LRPSCEMGMLHRSWPPATKASSLSC
jgi:hypothetical protein